MYFKNPSLVLEYDNHINRDYLRLMLELYLRYALCLNDWLWLSLRLSVCLRSCKWIYLVVCCNKHVTLAPYPILFPIKHVHALATNKEFSYALINEKTGETPGHLSDTACK